MKRFHFTADMYFDAEGNADAQQILGDYFLGLANAPREADYDCPVDRFIFKGKGFFCLDADGRHCYHANGLEPEGAAHA